MTDFKQQGESNLNFLRCLHQSTRYNYTICLDIFNFLIMDYHQAKGPHVLELTRRCPVGILPRRLLYLILFTLQVD